MKKHLTTQRLVQAGATRVGLFHDGRFEYAYGKSAKDAKLPGIYVITLNGIARGRTFVGQQETSRGFTDTIYQATVGSKPGLPEAIFDTSWYGSLMVYHLPVNKVPGILGGCPKQFELFGENMAKLQSLSAVSRQLFKVYNFEYQKR